MRFLNINRKITAVVAGALSPTLGHDALMVGTQTSLMVYDVEDMSHPAQVPHKEDALGDNSARLPFANLCALGHSPGGDNDKLRGV
eukprot:1419984-Amphidinium_carterae.2